MSRVSVSVVICSRNRPVLLRETIDSVLGGTMVPDELIVVDQSDRPQEDLARLQPRETSIQYVWDEQRGVSRARNRGLGLARSTLVAYLDDDVFVDPGWLAALVSALAGLGEGYVLTGRVLASSAETPGGWAPALVRSEVPATFEGRLDRDVLEAGNMAGYRRSLLAVGGFDPALGPGTRFPAGEDNDFGWRLLAAGYRIRYEPAATIHHRAWRGPEEYVPLRWRYGLGQGAYYAKHLSWRDGHMTRRLGRLIRKHLVLAARRARREPTAARGHLAYVAGVATGLVRWSLGPRRAAAASAGPTDRPPSVGDGPTPAGPLA